MNHVINGRPLNYKSLRSAEFGNELPNCRQIIYQYIRYRVEGVGLIIISIIECTVALEQNLI